MRDDIEVERRRRLVAIDSPVGVVDAVPIHGLEWCREADVVLERRR
jgi:hypothetical protein